MSINYNYLLSVDLAFCESYTCLNIMFIVYFMRRWDELYTLSLFSVSYYAMYALVVVPVILITARDSCL